MTLLLIGAAFAISACAGFELGWWKRGDIEVRCLDCGRRLEAP